MERKDTAAQDRFGSSYEESKLGGKLHRAFMAEVGVEMCQAEVAHHANKCPEYLVSRDIKHLYLYKKALGISKPAKKDASHETEEEEWRWDEDEAPAQLATKPSDVDLYEDHHYYKFRPTNTPPSPHLPVQTTPEE